MSQTEAETSTEKNIVLDIAADALEKVISIREKEDDPEKKGLRVEITGSSGVDFTYDLSFSDAAEADETDLVYEVGELPIIIPKDTVENLTGSTLDLPNNPVQGGLVIRNPNRPSLIDGMDMELKGSIAEKVSQLLNQQINPSLAAHGGYAELVNVEDSKVYLKMGGGCQGCAMSAATLREGITVVLGEMIPEITEVIDITDHESGENPFYQ